MREKRRRLDPMLGDRYDGSRWTGLEERAAEGFEQFPIGEIERQQFVDIVSDQRSCVGARHLHEDKRLCQSLCSSSDVG